METVQKPAKHVRLFPEWHLRTAPIVAITEPLGRCALVLVLMQGEDQYGSTALSTLAAFAVS
jgi:hypothetical protein